jgi:hypothetical protein
MPPAESPRPRLSHGHAGRRPTQLPRIGKVSRSLSPRGGVVSVSGRGDSDLGRGLRDRGAASRRSCPFRVRERCSWRSRGRLSTPTGQPVEHLGRFAGFSCIGSQRDLGVDGPTGARSRSPRPPRPVRRCLARMDQGRPRWRRLRRRPRYKLRPGLVPPVEVALYLEIVERFDGFDAMRRRLARMPDCRSKPTFCSSPMDRAR